MRPRWEELQGSTEGSVALKASGRRNLRVGNGSGQRQGEESVCAASTRMFESAELLGQKHPWRQGLEGKWLFRGDLGEL